VVNSTLCTNVVGVGRFFLEVFRGELEPPSSVTR
jgi:hypothetical protein